MKKLIIIHTLLLALLIASCGGGNSSNQSANSTQESAAAMSNEPSTYDPKRGEGKYTSIDLGAGLDAAMAKSGEQISGVKCSSCHKYTDERLVGPGWAGVTSRRAPEWIMNFITNPDPMIDKDPEVQAQLELCLVRMPNQGLSDDDARHVLEFMRKNDGVK